VTPALLADLLAARAERVPCVVATRLRDGAQVLLVDPADQADALGAAGREAISADRSLRVEIEGDDWFLHVHAPPPRLIVIGAVHIAQSLAPMALMIGADVAVCDPRGRYATAERFPGIRLRNEWPDEAVRLERPGRNSAVVALSHDPKLDDPGLAAALETPCGYVGALGSRRSHATRLTRLAELGIEAAALRRILGPVGMDLRAIGAAEIAVSILAEWIAQRRGGRLRDRGEPGDAR
jgi:xanthine dehydrogenase accessory factor